MTITACQAYLANELQGLTTTLTNAPLQAYVEPPTPGSADTPLAYILSADGDGKRQTMGGLAGYYLDTHQIKVWLEWMIPPGSQNGNQAFTNLIDTVIATVRQNYAGAIFITDPVTGGESQLLVIGDKLSYRYVPQPVLGEDQQGWIDYVAQITFEVQEKTQQNP